MHLDQLFPFVGTLPVAHVHDGTIQPFIEHEEARGLAPKSINNALGVVSTVLNRAASVWRDEHGQPWLSQAPAKISRLSLKGKQAKAYPLTWTEQDRLIKALPRHLVDRVLFAVNTGCREQEICRLRWDREVNMPELETSVFILLESITKTSTERVVVLNAVARRVIESRRGKHKEFVFTYRGKPMGKLNNSDWKRAWRKQGCRRRKAS
jgi:integrase